MTLLDVGPTHPSLNWSSTDDDALNTIAVIAVDTADDESAPGTITIVL